MILEVGMNFGSKYSCSTGRDDLNWLAEALWTCSRRWAAANSLCSAWKATGEKARQVAVRVALKVPWRALVCRLSPPSPRRGRGTARLVGRARWFPAVPVYAALRGGHHSHPVPPLPFGVRRSRRERGKFLAKSCLSYVISFEVLKSFRS